MNCGTDRLLELVQQPQDVPMEVAGGTNRIVGEAIDFVYLEPPTVESATRTLCRHLHRDPPLGRSPWPGLSLCLAITA